MRTQCTLESVMVRNGLWSLSDIRFTCSDVYGAITFLFTCDFMTLLFDFDVDFMYFVYNYIIK